MKPKSMRSVEQLLASVASGEEKLSPAEERLVDRITFEHTGKRFGRFKNAEDKEKPTIPTVGKKKSFRATEGGWSEQSDDNRKKPDEKAEYPLHVQPGSSAGPPVTIKPPYIDVGSVS